MLFSKDTFLKQENNPKNMTQENKIQYGDDV